MKVSEINGKFIRISKATVTVIDPETGKTCGLIRDVETYASIREQPRRYYDFVQEKKVKNCNACPWDVMFKKDGEWYYCESESIRFFADKFSDDMERLQRKRDAVQEFGAITLVPARVL